MGIKPERRELTQSGARYSLGMLCHIMDPKISHFFRKSLREMAERLADKYEEAKEKQEDQLRCSCTL